MTYDNVKEGIFLERPNRFIAKVRLGDRIVTAHVKNTGRCKELLVAGVTVFLQDFSESMGTRKLAYSLIGVKKGDRLINMDSQAPNRVVQESLKDKTLVLPQMPDLVEIKPEKSFGDSRFDFYLKDRSGKEGYLEVKGVTLEENGIARFPDAPTERGVKHLKGLITARKSNFYAGVIFVIQMDGISHFEPNYATHREFGEVLQLAAENGVFVYAVTSKVTKDTLIVSDFVSVKFTNDRK